MLLTALSFGTQRSILSARTYKNNEQVTLLAISWHLFWMFITASFPRALTVALTCSKRVYFWSFSSQCQTSHGNPPRMNLNGPKISGLHANHQKPSAAVRHTAEPLVHSTCSQPRAWLRKTQPQTLGSVWISSNSSLQNICGHLTHWVWPEGKG